MPALLQIQIELDLSVEPMTGRLSAGGGPAHAFTGWTGLAAALDRVTAASRDAFPNPQSQEDSHAP